MKKKVLILLLIFMILALFLVLITLVFKRTSLNSEEFINILEKNEFEVKNIIREYNYNFVKDAYLGKSSDNWNIEFLILDNDEHAKELFNNFHKEYRNFNERKSFTIIYGLNYNVFTLTTSNYYMYISRINNTLIYVKSNKKYKEDIKETVKMLGY